MKPGGRSPTSVDACGEVIGCDASCQEVGACSTSGGSQGMYITLYITFPYSKKEQRQNPLWLWNEKSKTGVPVPPPKKKDKHVSAKKVTVLI